MTAAFNLSQLANNLNSSGQLDATDGLTGLVANSNLASSGTASSSTFLRGDRSWQSVPTPTIASTAEAQAGTNNTNFITPLRMREGFNASGNAPVYACRAWVSFNGTGSVTIRGSGNVSSITDNGTANYTVNFTTAMPNANYSAVASSCAGNSGASTASIFNNAGGGSVINPTTTGFRIGTLEPAVAWRDSEFVTASVFC